MLKAGLVTDAVFSDYDMDGDEDLIVTAEWSPIKIYENDNGYFNSVSLTSLQDTEGIWFSIEAVDLDNDGDEDYLLGNLGLNSKFKASTKKPFHVFCDDFDNNGTYDVVFSKKYQGELVPMRALGLIHLDIFLKKRHHKFHYYQNHHKIRETVF